MKTTHYEVRHVESDDLKCKCKTLREAIGYCEIRPFPTYILQVKSVIKRMPQGKKYEVERP